MRNVIMVVPVLMINWYESENLNIGPKANHAPTIAKARMVAMGEPAAFVTVDAKRLNHSRIFLYLQLPLK
jgi:hypothetical protein